MLTQRKKNVFYLITRPISGLIAATVFMLFQAANTYAIDINRVGKILDENFIVERATIQVLPNANKDGSGKITLRCGSAWCSDDYQEVYYDRSTRILDSKGNKILSTDLFFHTGKTANVSIKRGEKSARRIRIYK